MKVYISSTYRDLRLHRAAVDHALRRMGHDVIGMEQYVAEGTAPLARVRADAGGSDAYVLIVGWRYGYVPVDPTNPQGSSITELELDAAIAAGKPVLAFLLDPEQPWPANEMDAHAAASGGGGRINAFRARVGTAWLAGIFTSPDNLAGQVTAAVARVGATHHMAERKLQEAPIAGGMAAFASGQAIADTTRTTILGLVGDAEALRWVPVRMRRDEWWSTRLFLLAALTDLLTPVRQIVFRHADGRFAGMATPAAVRAGLAGSFPQLAAINSAFLTIAESGDVQRAMTRAMQLWDAQMPIETERGVHVAVRWQLVQEWLGERLVRRAVRLDPDGELTMFHVQQIVEALLPDVPVERPPRKPRDAEPPPTPEPPEEPEIMVVDRDAFALELAREWVRTGLPRAPLA